MNPSSRSRFRGGALDRTDGVGKKYELRKSSKEFNYNCRQKIWRILPYINFIYATEKLHMLHRDTCSLSNAHGKVVIKARHGPFSRHGQCNDLNVLRWKKLMECNDRRSPCKK